MANTIYELNDKWLEEHKTHSLCWTTHTVFDNKNKSGGNKFKECMCYTCYQQARQLLEHVEEITIPKEKNRRRNRKKRSSHISFGAY
jgi:hypothetical protein